HPGRRTLRQPGFEECRSGDATAGTAACAGHDDLHGDTRPALGAPGRALRGAVRRADCGRRATGGGARMWLSKSDLHYTLRRMGKKPGFVLLAALVLAGGLSVCLIAFTITYSLGTKPIPVTNGERIVRICSLQICEPMMADDFARIREDITSLSNVGAYIERNGTRIEYNGEIWQQPAILTEWNLFQLSE